MKWNKKKQNATNSQMIDTGRSIEYRQRKSIKRCFKINQIQRVSKSHEFIEIR